MTYLKLTLLLLVSALAYGCSTLSERDCRNADWSGYGDRDGSRGKHHLAKYAKQCAEFGVLVDGAAYNNGYEKGLDQYCSERSTYIDGLRGEAFDYEVCGESRIKNAGYGYYRGLSERYWKRLESDRVEMQKLSAEFQELRRLLESDPNRYPMNPLIREQIAKIDKMLREQTTDIPQRHKP